LVVFADGGNMRTVEIAGAVIGIFAVLPIIADFLTGVLAAAGIERDLPLARWARMVWPRNLVRRICGLAK
jgi:hypothetical protein